MESEHAVGATVVSVEAGRIAVFRAKLTAAGKRLLGRLRTTHRGGVKERFADRFSDEGLETLDELLGRLTNET